VGCHPEQREGAGTQVELRPLRCAQGDMPAPYFSKPFAIVCNCILLVPS